jgi:Mor family transcriptional regulator
MVNRVVADEVEIWKALDGYPNYLLSNLGRVKTISVFHNKNIKYIGQIREAKRYPNKYPAINLYNGIKNTTYGVHKLVALTFMGICPEGYNINHKDLDKTNYWLNNLEYIPKSFNTIHSLSFGNKLGENHHNAKLTMSKVIEIRKLYSEGTTLRELNATYQVSIRTISDAINFTTWKGEDYYKQCYLGSILIDLKPSKYKYNRSPKGEKSGNSKLTNEQVIQIRKEYIFRSKEFGSYGLAKKYEVSQLLILTIVKREGWKHI